MLVLAGLRWGDRRQSAQTQDAYGRCTHEGLHAQGKTNEDQAGGGGRGAGAESRWKREAARARAEHRARARGHLYSIANENEPGGGSERGGETSVSRRTPR